MQGGPLGLKVGQTQHEKLGERQTAGDWAPFYATK